MKEYEQKGGKKKGPNKMENEKKWMEDQQQEFMKKHGMVMGNKKPGGIKKPNTKEEKEIAKQIEELRQKEEYINS